MCNNIYIQEKALEEQQHQHMVEIERRHNAVLATGHREGVRHIIGRSGALLITLGIWLERVERREIPVRA